MRKQLNRRNVAVAFDLDFQHATEIFEGIRDFCREGEQWNLMALNFGFEELLNDLVISKEIDGIIGSFISDAWIRTLENQDMAVVNVSKLSRIETVSTVGVDEREIGRIVANTLIDSGLNRFAYCGIPGCYFSQQRESGYKEFLAEHGYDYAILPNRDTAYLGERIETLTLPMGIFCANDFLARKLALLCGQLQLKVPDEIAIIGVGNSAIDSIFAGISLSSVALPSRQIGYAAARQLNRLLGNRNAKPEAINLPPEGIFQRESSLRQGIAQRAVERALNTIRENLAQPLTVNFVARNAGVSRRSLEMKFNEVLGRSPYAVITRLRMERAANLLLETQLRIYEVGERCGYPEQHQFSTAFKRYWRRSPKSFRESDAGEVGETRRRGDSEIGSLVEESGSVFTQ